MSTQKTRMLSKLHLEMVPPSMLTCPGYIEYTLQQYSQDTSRPSVNRCNTLLETLQICPQTEEVIATRSTEPDSEPPRKRKRSRHRASITPLAHPTHNLLLYTTQSNALPHSPDVNPQSRSAYNTLLGNAPDIKANPPGLQTELPEDGPPSKCTRSTIRHNSRFMPQECSQGISGSNSNYNDADCIHTGPDQKKKKKNSLHRPQAACIKERSLN
eukprot:1149568-Pelagomonas_calceolata.AAC.1